MSVLDIFLWDNKSEDMYELTTKIVINALLKGTPYEGLKYVDDILVAGQPAEDRAFTVSTFWDTERIVPKRITFSDWLVLAQVVDLFSTISEYVQTFTCSNYSVNEELPFSLKDINIHSVQENYITSADLSMASYGSTANRRYVYYIEDSGQYGVINENFMVM
ncbi:hypothetical protein [Paenibacillus sp. 1P03SA]|uniref:hypothetical protein n=1 Tax=Paenibacillus sp. 1P03SA TaxID=3132294 RepID=UPI00399FA4D2